MQHICCQKQIILEVIKMCKKKKKKESINLSKLQLGGLQLNKGWIFGGLPIVTAMTFGYIV